MPQTFIFKLDNVGYEGVFHTDKKTYETLTAVKTKTTLLLNKFSVTKCHYINNLMLFSYFETVQLSDHSVIVRVLYRIDNL